MKLEAVDFDPFAAPAQPSFRLEPVDGDPFAPKAQGGSAEAAVGMGLVSGVPVVGPYLKGGLENVAAGIRSLQSGKSFADEKAAVQAFDAATAARHPIATGAGEVGGGVLGTLPLAAAAPAAFGIGAGPLAARAGASALTGGVLGAADAGARGQDVGLGGGVGFITGGAAPVLAAGIGKAVGAIANRAHPVEVPTVPEIKAASQSAYRAADDAGVRIAPQTFSGLVDDIGTAVKEAGIDKTLHPRATAVLGRLQEASGSAPTLSEADTLRRVAQGAAKSLEPDERRIGKIILDRFDQRISSLTPENVVAGDPEAAVSALTQARELWSRYRKAELIGDALTKAERRADMSGSGGNVNNTMRQEIGKILNSPKKSRAFDETERAAMADIIRGTTGQNLLRRVGKISPATGALPTMAGLAATAVNPLYAVAPAIGTGAKVLADRGTRANIDALAKMVANGAPVGESQAAIAARERAKAIAQMLLSPTPAVSSRQLAR